MTYRRHVPELSAPTRRGALGEVVLEVHDPAVREAVVDLMRGEHCQIDVALASGRAHPIVSIFVTNREHGVMVRERLEQFGAVAFAARSAVHASHRMAVEPGLVDDQRTGQTIRRIDFRVAGLTVITVDVTVGDQHLTRSAVKPDL